MEAELNALVSRLIRFKSKCLEPIFLDIDECARGTHQCSSTQICKNGYGYHVCTCPPGHKLNVNNHCEDINECEYYRGRVSLNLDPFLDLINLLLN